MYEQSFSLTIDDGSVGSRISSNEMDKDETKDQPSEQGRHFLFCLLAAPISIMHVFVIKSPTTNKKGRTLQTWWATEHNV